MELRARRLHVKKKTKKLKILFCGHAAFVVEKKTRPPFFLLSDVRVLPPLLLFPVLNTLAHSGFAAATAATSA